MNNVNLDIVKCVSEILACNENDVSEDSGYDLSEGWDSVAHLNILMCLEKKFLVEFSEDDFIFLRTVDDLYQKIQS